MDKKKVKLTPAIKALEQRGTGSSFTETFNVGAGETI